MKIVTDRPTHEGSGQNLAFTFEKEKADDLSYYNGMIVPEVFVLELRKK
jgi:hypothetical protein